MLALAIVLLVLALLFGGIGFAVHTLWWVALVVIIIAGVLYLSGGRRY
jgi:hypothetical protein